MNRRLGLLAAATLACLTTACVTTGPIVEPVAPPPPDPAEVSIERFEEAVAMYREASADGVLSESECTSVSQSFDDVYKKSAPKMLVARFNVGAVLEACGDAKAARTIYEELAAQDFHLAINNLGVMHWELGEKEQALRLFERSVDADKIRAFSARNNLAAAHREIYASRRTVEDFERAELQIKRVLAVDTSNQAAYENLARLYYDRGRHGERSYLMLAQLVVQQGLQVLGVDGGDSADLHNIAGLLLMEQNNQVEALRAFKRAAAIDGDHVDAHLNIAFVSIRFRDYAAAEASLHKALEAPSVKTNVEALLAMGVAKRGLHKYEEAQGWYERAIELDASDPRPHYNLGILHHEHLIGQEHVDRDEIQEYFEQARAHFETVVDLSSSHGAQAEQLADARDRIVIINDTLDILRTAIDIEVHAADIMRRQAELERLEIERLRGLEEDAQRLEAEASSAGAGSNAA